jgi:hypothetical protein
LLESDGLSDKGVRELGVDADLGLTLAGDLPRPLELALGIIVMLDPNPRVRLQEALHPAGVPAMSDHLPAIIKDDVREEALVALHESARRERRVESMLGVFHRHEPYQTRVDCVWALPV